MDYSSAIRDRLGYITMQLWAIITLLMLIMLSVTGFFDALYGDTKHSTTIHYRCSIEYPVGVWVYDGESMLMPPAMYREICE